jgi:hypothetical protein
LPGLLDDSLRDSSVRSVNIRHGVASLRGFDAQSQTLGESNAYLFIFYQLQRQPLGQK